MKSGKCICMLICVPLQTLVVSTGTSYAVPIQITASDGNYAVTQQSPAAGESRVRFPCWNQTDKNNTGGTGA